jgi:nucleoid-associated protein YgaU
MHGTDLSLEEYQELETTRERLWSEATALLAEGQALEQAGKIEEAQATYQHVATMANDYPGLQDHLKRTDEALTLTRAVRHRSQRIRAHTEQKTAPGQSRSIFSLLTAGILVGSIGAGLWFYFAQPAPKIDQAVTVEQQSRHLPQSVPAVPPKPGVEPASITVDQPIPPQQSAPSEPTRTTQEPAVSNPSQPSGITVSTEAPTPPTVTEPKTAVTIEPSDKREQLPSSDPAVTSLPAPTAPLPLQPLPEKKTYMVQPGDTLSLIAERLFCTQNTWQQIYQQNSTVLSNPHKLQPGVQLDLSGIESRCPPVR